MDAAPNTFDPLVPFEARSSLNDDETSSRSRGVRWVLQWYAAATTLLIAACVLAQFGYCLAAERTLLRAARAGALEATLPRANYQTVVQTVERRLTDYPSRLASRMRFCLLQNGILVRGVIRPREGDRLTVALAVPTRDVLPRWLRAVNFWRDARLEVRAERQVPGRQIAGI